MDRKKYVRIMSDLCTQGVWSYYGGCYEASDLPVSSRLQERLRDWNWWYDVFSGTFNRDGTQGDLDEFSAIGLDLARKVKAELPDWTVVYSDKGAGERARALERRFGVIVPRCTYEYVITLYTDHETHKVAEERIVVIGSKRYVMGWVVKKFIQSLAESGATIVTDKGPDPDIGSWVTEEALNNGLNLVHLPGVPELDDQMIACADRLVVFWARDSHRLTQAIRNAQEESVPVEVFDGDGRPIPLTDILGPSRNRYEDVRDRMNQDIQILGQPGFEEINNSRPNMAIGCFKEGERHPNGMRINEAGWYLLRPIEAASRYFPLGPFRCQDDALHAASWQFFDDRYPISP